MGFQTAVDLNQGFGVIGEIFDSGPHRAQPFIIDSTDPANNVFGRAFTVLSEGKAAAGAEGGSFAGILINPKAHASYGTAAGGPLAPTLTLADNVVGELLSEGSIIVTLPAAAAIGDLVYFTDATGVLTTIAPGGVAPANSTLIEGAYVDRFTVADAGLAVITLAGSPRSGAPA